MTIAHLVWILLLGLALFLASRAWPLKGRSGGPISANTSASVASGDTFTIGTYNIHRARGLDGRKDLARIAEVIRETDIVALQEIEGTSLFRRSDQASKLAVLLKRCVHFAPTRKLLFFPQRGNGLLSRFSIGRWSTQPVFPSTGRAHRSYTVYELEHPKGLIHILNTHLSKPSEGEQPLEVVMQAFASYPRAVLLGDFNAPFDDSAMRRYLPPDAIDALEGLDQSARRVDMILIRGLVAEAAFTAPAGPSDHPFYAARIRVATEDR